MKERVLASFAEVVAAKSIEVGDCLEWQGAMGCSGSASQPIIKTRRDGKPIEIYVARKVWELNRGPIPAGRIVYRSCCNNRCVGIDHLRLGRRGDAMRARKRLGLSKHSPSTIAALTVGIRKGPNVKYTIEAAREVRRLAANGLGTGEISAATGVHPDMVSDIRRGRAWRETAPVGSVFSWRPAA